MIAQTKPGMLCNGNGAISHLQNDWDLLRTSVTAGKIDEIHFLPHLESFMWEEKFEKVLYNSLMGCSLFSNYHFQMGFTVIGFAEHFGQWYLEMKAFRLFYKFGICDPYVPHRPFTAIGGLGFSTNVAASKL